MFSFIVVVFAPATLLLSGGCFPSGSEDAISSFDNEFTSTGTALSISKIADEKYYGRVLFRSAGNLYGAAISFNLNTNDAQTAYFANFSLDRLVLFVNITTAITIISSPVDLSVPGSYSFASNGLSISDTLSRYVGFNINFGNNANITDVFSAAAVFTRDFTTLVGGDDSTFFFIAQKASSLPTVTESDLLGRWYMIDFGVTGFGNIQLGSLSRLTAGGTGGAGHTIFTGINITGERVYGGEFKMTDSGVGASGLGYDSTPTGDDITMDGTVDGVFLLAPSKKFILGFDARNDRYFAGSR